jgi:hypothetical protein
MIENEHEVSALHVSALVPVTGEVRQVRWQASQRVNVRPNWKEQPAMPAELTDLAIRKVGNVLPIIRRYLRQRGFGSAGCARIWTETDHGSN